MLPRRCITWRGATDKAGRTTDIPYPDSHFTTVREPQRRLGALGGFLLPRRDDANRCAPPELLSQWIRSAERGAGLPKLKAGTTHPYRRKWRSERSDHALKAVAKAGGWSDIPTTLRVYDHPDDEAILRVTSEPRRRTEPRPVAAGG